MSMGSSRHINLQQTLHQLMSHTMAQARRCMRQHLEVLPVTQLPMFVAVMACACTATHLLVLMRVLAWQHMLLFLNVHMVWLTVGKQLSFTD